MGINKMDYKETFRDIYCVYKKCCKKNIAAKIIAQHDIIPLYNPTTQTYRKVNYDKNQGWFVTICPSRDVVYAKYRVVSSVHHIAEMIIMFESEVSRK